MSFVCATCGVTHEEVPLSFAADFPDSYADLTLDEREQRALCSSDQCIIDDEFFSVRGLVLIPILGQSQPFEWGAWARVTPEIFSEIDESWNEDGRELIRGPYKGRLANRLADHLNALNLRLTIRLSGVGQRPQFTIDESHILREQQKQGISQHEAFELSERLLNAAS